MSNPIMDENNGYEVLPAAKDLNLSLGIRCMELNVQEVDDAVRQFNKQAGDIGSPSWKFPHVTLEKLDVNHVMNAFRAHASISDDQLYMELMELLIDRLYYAIMTSFEFVNGLEALFINAGASTTSSEAGSGDGKKKRDWDPLEIAEKSSADNTPKPFHTANIGMLVRQFSMKMMGLENIVLNNMHCVGINNEKKESKEYFSLRHSEAQTDETMQDGCDSCFIAQNILKLVADKVHHSVKALNEADSNIAKTRLELRKDSLSITQRGTLLRWYHALMLDCENITNYANMLLDINVKNQDNVRALKEHLEIKEENFEKKLGALQENLDKINNELSEEKDGKAVISQQKDAAVIKSLEVDKKLQEKVKECEKLCQEKEALQRSFNIAEELNMQIKQSLAWSNGEMEKLKKSQKEEKEAKDKLAKQVKHLSQELAKAGQEILKMNDKYMKVEYLQNEIGELQAEVKRQKCAAREVQFRNDELNKILQERSTKIKSLQDEVSDNQSKIEILTLYPDLNGPINTPTRDSELSCVETMEMQIKSNQHRIKVLNMQNDRLGVAVDKIKKHMKGKDVVSIQSLKK